MVKVVPVVRVAAYPWSPCSASQLAIQLAMAWPPLWLWFQHFLLYKKLGLYVSGVPCK